MTTKTSLVKSEQPMENATFNDGYQFNFTFDKYDILVRASAKSGKELIYLDNELISETRSLGFKSCQRFMLGDKKCEIELRVKNILTGEVHCTLIADNTHVETQKVALQKCHKKWTHLLFFLGLFFGAFCGYFGVSALLTSIN